LGSAQAEGARSSLGTGAFRTQKHPSESKALTVSGAHKFCAVDRTIRNEHISLSSRLVMQRELHTNNRGRIRNGFDAPRCVVWSDWPAPVRGRGSWQRAGGGEQARDRSRRSPAGHHQRRPCPRGVGLPALIQMGGAIDPGGDGGRRRGPKGPPEICRFARTSAKRSAGALLCTDGTSPPSRVLSTPPQPVAHRP
jgi:hypothetical protein